MSNRRTPVYIPIYRDPPIEPEPTDPHETEDWQEGQVPTDLPEVDELLNLAIHRSQREIRFQADWLDADDE